MYIEQDIVFQVHLLQFLLMPEVRDNWTVALEYDDAMEESEKSNVSFRLKPDNVDLLPVLNGFDEGVIIADINGVIKKRK